MKRSLIDIKRSFHLPGAHLVVHKHALWLCIGAALVAGLITGFLIGLEAAR